MRGRRAALVLALTAAGVLAGLLATALLPETYRASGAVILTRQGKAPGGDPGLAEAVVAAEDLLRSRAVAVSAVANLKLQDSPDALLDDLRVEGDPETSLVRLSVDAASGEEARRRAQELAEVFTVLYNGRFGPATTASIWETPAAEPDPVAPRLGLDLALGGLAGLLLGVAVVALSGPRRRATAAPASAPIRTAVRPAGPPWTLAALGELAAQAPAQRAADLRRLVAAMREFAGPGGAVPRKLDQLVEESFGDLLSR